MVKPENASRHSSRHVRNVLTLTALVAGSTAFGFVFGYFCQSVIMGIIGGAVFAGLSGLWSWRVRRSGEISVEAEDLHEAKRAQGKRYGPLGDANSRVTGLG
ncbi:hypothetical protein FHX49_000257 [Microbacterium endophyticum]|uniref:Uncharacterized protein n=1 Tax=Microbacterium endophyticum TaxID=1526412 RepID=A0A7W4V0P4_9MICO|nr:hypothetical protein [Microbacterium endophyticum]MBB2974716.1 hypothetical protein [Microbacterium endophyticum]NIK37013.1 hypothetical protein [Microbacterium endophyticum]